MGLLETLTYACLTLYRIMLSVYVSAHIELPHLQVSASLQMNLPLYPTQEAFNRILFKTLIVHSKSQVWLSF